MYPPEYHRDGIRFNSLWYNFDHSCRSTTIQTTHVFVIGEWMVHKYVTIGVIGHIDHGKTALVRSLTGIDTDRLEEEKRRGMTIDLGFAYLRNDTTLISFVDVPGHERLVHTMISGAYGVQGLLLVVAADDGVMPQTIEHLDICRALGKRHLIIALTKIDRVDSEWLDFVKETLQIWLKEQGLQDTPIFPVSSVTGEGIDKLRTYLMHYTKTLKPPSPTRYGRLAIDRSFSLPGHGTIVTGTLQDGTFRKGHILRHVPSGKEVSVRTLQVHGLDVDEAPPGTRVALNLHGIHYSEIKRGDWILHEHAAYPGTTWFVLVHFFSTQHPWEGKTRARVRFHHGTLVRTVFIRLLEKQSPTTYTALIRSDEPIFARICDRFILRQLSPMHTVGYGIFLERFSEKPKKFLIKSLHKSFPDAKSTDPVVWFRTWIGWAGERGRDASEILQATGYLPSTLHTLAQHSDLIALHDDEGNIRRLWTRQFFEHLKTHAFSLLEHYAREHPYWPWMKRTAWIAQWEYIPEHDASLLITQWLKKGDILQKNDAFTLPHCQPAHLPNSCETVLKDLQEAGFSGFPYTEFKQKLIKSGLHSHEVDDIMKRLQDEGALVIISTEGDPIAVHRNSLKALQQFLSQFPSPSISVQELKQFLGTSRKICFGYLSYAHLQKWLRREGNVHRILIR